jgi:anaerobic ribonucleoside-triphosphate reductase
MVKVDKFIFDLDGKKVEFTEDECMELMNKLNELFGKPIIPYIPPVLYPTAPVAPVLPWTITCEGRHG